LRPPLFGGALAATVVVVVVVVEARGRWWHTFLRTNDSPSLESLIFSCVAGAHETRGEESMVMN
jgi:hypothetical protein